MATNEDGGRAGRRMQAGVQGLVCALHHPDCQLGEGSLEDQAQRPSWLWELKGLLLLLLSLALYVLACSMQQSLQEVFRSFPRTAMRRNKWTWPLVPFQTPNATPQVLPARWVCGKERRRIRKDHTYPSSLNFLPSLIAGPWRPG